MLVVVVGAVTAHMATQNSGWTAPPCRHVPTYVAVVVMAQLSPEVLELALDFMEMYAQQRMPTIHKVGRYHLRW